LRGSVGCRPIEALHGATCEEATVADAKTRRLVALVALVVAATLSAASACNDPDRDAPARVGGVNPRTSGNVGPSATTIPPLSAKPATYPQTARVYGEWVIASWIQSQPEWMAELVTAQVEDQILSIPGPPDRNWVFHSCQAAGSTSACQFINGSGDVITLTVTTALLTKAHAVTAVNMEPTSFPYDGVEYVKAFVAAWQSGNTARMTALAVPDVMTYTGGTAPPAPPVTYALSGGGAGLMHVTVTAGAFHSVVDVGTTLLGTPHAITGATP
jgi:hypothetical protein